MLADAQVSPRKCGSVLQPLQPLLHALRFLGGFLPIRLRRDSSRYQPFREPTAPRSSACELDSDTEARSFGSANDRDARGRASLSRTVQVAVLTAPAARAARRMGRTRHGSTSWPSYPTARLDIESSGRAVVHGARTTCRYRVRCRVRLRPRRTIMSIVTTIHTPWKRPASSDRVT